MKVIIPMVTLLIIGSTISCGVSLSLWNGGDIIPPHIVSITTQSQFSIAIEFNEPVLSTFSKVIISDNIQIDSMQNHTNSRILVHTDTQLLASQQYTITIYAKDTEGNSVLAIEYIYGYNNNIPSILINEFTCEGTKTNPDKVELIVLSSGNISGLALQQGGNNTYSKQVVFPDIQVEKGDFIVVHWAADPQEPLTHETTHKNESTHRHAYSDVWDFFADEHNRGISNTNGSLSLIVLSDKSILDGVVYSVKNNDLSHKYKGFGSSKSYTWAQELLAAHAWISQDTNILLPDDTVNPKDSTTTRSIGRDINSTDTNTKHDWHIANTRKSSFGLVNTTEWYEK